MSNLKTLYFTVEDGSELAVHQLGGDEGHPIVLIHGLASSAHVNWIKYGTAACLAEAGYKCLMPDLRGHGYSRSTSSPDAPVPMNILARDNAYLIQALKLKVFDLVGFSLGARTSIKLVVDGLKPRRLILSGMGLTGLTDWGRRRDYFIDVTNRIDSLKRGDPGFMAATFMKTMGMKPHIVRQIVKSFDNFDPKELQKIGMPALVLCGSNDRDNGSPEELAHAIPLGSFAGTPGDHMSCVTRPDFGRAICSYVSAP